MWLLSCNFIFQQQIYYYDLIKDLLVLSTYVHISTSILISTNDLIRYTSVGGINLMALCIYSIGIVAASIMTLHRFVKRNHKTHNVFSVNTDEKLVNASINVYPLHWVLIQDWHTKIRILRLQRKLKHHLETKITDKGNFTTLHKDFIIKTCEEIDVQKRQLYKINMFYQNINIRESLSERQFQLSILTENLAF